MTFDQLDYFLAVVDFNSFTRASEEIFLSQSSLSKNIKSLENELGSELFIRHGSHLSLTPTGETFLKFARKVSLEHKNMISQLPKSGASYLCTLRLGALPLLAQYNLIEKFSKFHSKNTNIHFDLYEGNQEMLIKMLDNHQLDMAVVRTDYITVEKYDIASLCTDVLVLVCAKTNPLAKLKIVSMNKLKKERFVILDFTSDTYRLLLDICRVNGFVPNVRATISRPNPLIGMIGEDIGISVLPKKMVDLNIHKNVAVVPLSETINTTLALVKRKTHKTNYRIDKFYQFCLNLNP